MVREALPTRPVENWREERDEWVRQVERLIGEAEKWATEKGWLVDREHRELSEDRLGGYTAPALKMRRPDGTVLLLEPVARFVVGAAGRVEFSVFPSYDHEVLARTGEGWEFVSSTGRPARRAWSRDSFLKTADRLATRA